MFKHRTRCSNHPILMLLRGMRPGDCPQLMIGALPSEFLLLLAHQERGFVALRGAASGTLVTCMAEQMRSTEACERLQ